ncbi:MAG: GDSL-type esterase/lipase family protein [Gemmatimonadota bacterium]
MRHTNVLLALLVAALLVGAPEAVSGQVADPDPTRFSEEIEAFERYDRFNTVPRNAIVLVGSSSIRFWPTGERFPGLTVVNRGFGGSHISDVNHHIEETVLKHDPSIVIHYAGDNDIAAGKSPQQVLEDYQLFAERVLEADPRAQVLYISVKPSILRWEMWSQMAELNQLVRDYSASKLNLHFVDVAGPMLRSGEPDPAHFVADGLHLTPAGYDVWTEVVGQAIARIRGW